MTLRVSGLTVALAIGLSISLILFLVDYAISLKKADVEPDAKAVPSALERPA